MRPNRELQASVGGALSMGLDIEHWLGLRHVEASWHVDAIRVHC